VDGDGVGAAVGVDVDGLDADEVQDDVVDVAADPGAIADGRDVELLRDVRAVDHQPVGAGQPVAGHPVDDVVAVAGVPAEGVVAGRAGERVVSAAALDPVVQAVARERVAQGPARDVLDRVDAGEGQGQIGVDHLLWFDAEVNVQGAGGGGREVEPVDASVRRD